MEKWKNYRLGDICDVSSSKRIYSSEYCKSGVPFYRGKEIIEKHFNNAVSTELYISRSRYNEIKRKFAVPQISDILLTSVGTLGIPWLVDETEFYFKDGNLTWLKAKQNKISSKFLYLWLNSPQAQHQIDMMSIGSTQKALTIETLNKFCIFLPSLEIQEKVCSVFYSVLDKIKVNRQINTNLEQQVLAYYNYLFIDNYNVNRRKCRMNEYFDISIGKTPPRQETQWFKTQSNDVVWVSISDMAKCGLYINKSSEQLTKEAIKKFNIPVVPDNTLLLSFKLTIGRIAITNGALVTNEAIAHFKTDQKIINEYLYCYLKRFDYDKMGNTSSIAVALNSRLIKEMPFIITESHELQTFYDYAHCRFQYIKANLIEISTLSTLRDTLLPKLMSGEIDVSKIELG